MAETIQNLIRKQWQKRHSANDLVRRDAQSLIKVHVELLRGMRK